MKRLVIRTTTGHIYTPDGKIPVKCYPITIPGLEQYDFIVHRPWYDWSKLYPFKPAFFADDSWTVSEVTTGRNVFPSSWSGGWSNKTRKGAIAIATDHLLRNKARFVQAMQNYGKETQ